MLSLYNVSYAYGPTWVLKDISFGLAAGDFLFLTGPSGAGKSTLLRLLYGELPVMRGEVRVAGFQLRRLKSRELPQLRRRVGVVFQDFKVLPERTVYQNVALALEVQSMARKTIDKRVAAVLRALHLDDKSRTLCRRLSGGEQQRVAIARAMVINPQLILADEPTGNLDPGLSHRLIKIFRQFHTFGTTVVMATHSPEMLRAVPEAKVLHLENGQVAGANWPHNESLVPEACL